MIHCELVRFEQYGGPRDTMVVHSLSGLLTSLKWQELLDELRPILKHLRYRNGDIILGLDGPGMVPALGLADLTGLPYIFATKANLARSPKLVFHEPLSPRPDIFIYGLRRGMSVIVVDDGIGTGQTLASCVKTLTEEGIAIRAIVTITEARKHNARQMLPTLVTRSSPSPRTTTNTTRLILLPAGSPILPADFHSEGRNLAVSSFRASFFPSVVLACPGPVTRGTLAG